MLRVVEPQQNRALRVLVGEDNHKFRLILVKLLQPQFAVVDAVADGRSLVDAALVHGPDVIVSDVSMPHLTGIEAMALLRKAGHTPPFVLVTLNAGDALEWINLGALAVVDKVDAKAELVAAVSAAAAGCSYLSATVRRLCP